MRDIVLRMGLLEEFNEEETQEVLERLLETWVQINEIWWRAHPEAPPLYTWGVNYEREAKGTPETWVCAPMIRRQKYHIDCDDWAPARAGELRARLDEPARVILPMRKVRGADGKIKRLYHVQVERADGRIEDPSKVLGMGLELPSDPDERRAAIVLRLADSGHQRTRDLILGFDAQARAGDPAAEKFMRLLARVARRERDA